MLHLHLLRYFAEVAKTGSLRRASETLLVAPSAISRQIANLEQSLGTQLFERSFRGMVPTEAGRILLQFVDEENVRIQRVLGDIDDLSGLRRGTVRLAVVEAVTTTFLPELTSEFRTAHPGINFRIEVCGTHEIAQRLAADQADIGLAYNVLSRDDLILVGRIPQPLRLICRPHHPLSSRTSVAMKELDGVQVALPDSSYGIRYVVDRAAAAAGMALSLVYEANSLQLIKALVRVSDVISFMPPMTFERESANGSLLSLQIEGPNLEQSSIDVITTQDRKLPAAALAFLEKLQGWLRNPK